MHRGLGLRHIVCSSVLVLSLASGPWAARAEEGAPAPAPAEKSSEAEALERIRQRETEYRTLFRELDARENKVTRTLEEYFDPKTSERRRGKLRKWLRSTPITKPEDKQALKAAVFEPRFRVLLGDIEMALLHAIQGKPEEADKEFLLDILKSDIPGGWLDYAMLKAWDVRYVPYLLKWVEDQPRSYSIIEILGRMKVQEAVPALEEALKDENGTIRKYAYYALKDITGKEYEWQARRAEGEPAKENPEGSK